MTNTGWYFIKDVEWLIRSKDVACGICPSQRGFVFTVYLEEVVNIFTLLYWQYMPNGKIIYWCASNVDPILCAHWVSFHPLKATHDKCIKTKLQSLMDELHNRINEVGMILVLHQQCYTLYTILIQLCHVYKFIIFYIFGSDNWC